MHKYGHSIEAEEKSFWFVRAKPFQSQKSKTAQYRGHYPYSDEVKNQIVGLKG